MMIITTVTSPARTLGAAGQSIQWRCIARRGMLHTECESIDHVRLAAGTDFALRGRYATEQVWFAVRGTGQVRNDPESTTGHPLRQGDLVIAPPDSHQLVLHADSAGLELLWLTVLPSAVTRALPSRKPVIP
jgi:mannose-6-phosphate isomerase-like protein (cupin superfamily)